MLLVDFQCPHVRSIVDRRILKAAELLTRWRHKIQELHIDLNVMAWDLFLIADRRNRALALPIRKAIELVSFENLVNSSWGNSDAMLAFQIPTDAHRAKMIALP